MTTKRHQVQSEQISTMNMQQRLWVLRILLNLGAKNKFVEKEHFNNDILASELGLGHWVDVDFGEFNRGKVLRALKSQLSELESRKCKVDRQTRTLRQNIGKLKSAADLTDTDCDILEFVLHLHTNTSLEACTDYLVWNTRSHVVGALSTILDLPHSQVKAALSEQGSLIKSGLLSYRADWQEPRSKLSPINDFFVDNMFTQGMDVMSLMQGAFKRSDKASLRLNDYQHIKSELSLMLDYLNESKQNKGINILLHGEPGTGKTELVKLIAKKLGKSLFEVSCIDADGNSISGEKRLRSYRICQHLLSSKSSLLLFDEIEDVFNDGGFFLPSTAMHQKAWINSALESNAVPTFWITNTTSGIDPAFIRRFDIVFAVPSPPRQQRQKLSQKIFRNKLPVSTLEQLAERPEITPAVTERVAKVALRVSRNGRLNPDNVRQLVNGVLENQGFKPLKKYGNDIQALYDPAFISADYDIDKLISGLANSPNARVCLFGPPGTGKTAVCHYASRELDMPLHSHKVSDLMSKWVGETEEKIARAFEAAEADGAILLIDEVDSFLMDRTKSTANWEATMVNEMLTQMESFSGIFFASTNLMDNLDKASLRRFDAKIRFNFLNAAQSENLLKKYCKQLKLRLLAKSIKQIRALNVLTPGDFAAVGRQHRFVPLRDSSAFVQRLTDECKLKNSDSRSIGFICT